MAHLLYFGCGLQGRERVPTCRSAALAACRADSTLLTEPANWEYEATAAIAAAAVAAEAALEVAWAAVGKAPCA